MTAKKIFSSELSGEILDAFTDYCTRNGYIKYRALEAAMKVFMSIPPSSQTELMKGSLNQEEINAYLSSALLDDAVLKILYELSPKDRLSLLQDVKKAKEKFSRRQKG